MMMMVTIMTITTTTHFNRKLIMWGECNNLEIMSFFKKAKLQASHNTCQFVNKGIFKQKHRDFGVRIPKSDTRQF